DLPCIRMPVRKILAAAQTASTVVAAISSAETAICHPGGPGASETRSIIRNGAAVGMSDSTVAIVPSGARRTGTHMNIGTIITIMTGVIMPCESLRSEHAAPTARNTDPNIRIDMTRTRKNHA